MTNRLTLATCTIVFFVSNLLLFNGENNGISAQEAISTTFATIVSSIFTDDQQKDMEKKAKCFQQRFRTDEQKGLDRADCADLMDNFCDHIQCEQIKSCPSGQTLVPNQVGHKCCPACITFLPDGVQCVPGSVLEQCDNGLYCDPSKRICHIPGETQACLRDYHNRMSFRKKAKRDPPTGFWVPAENGPMEMLFEYAEDMELPACTPGLGNYDIKQRFKNKAFCVNPDTGVPTFGIADFGKASNVTCKCSNAMYDRLSRIDQIDPNDYIAKEEQLNKLDTIITNHYSDTHMKCTQTGDYHEMQCINETCLCVNEFTGIPLTTVDDFEELQERLSAASDSLRADLEDEKNAKNKGLHHRDSSRELTEEEKKKLDEEEKKKEEEDRKKKEARIPTKEVNSSATAIFGAFRSLLCFDAKRAKVVNSNFSKDVYIEDCQNQIHTSMNMQKHFHQKGTSVKGLETKTCGYDDRFSRKQCLPDSCRCSDPYGSSIASYGVELAKGAEMDCRCALEEYYVGTEKQSFDKLQCDGLGNYAPLQCIGARMCYCSDPNGAPISKEFNFECANSFIKKYAPGYSLSLICNAMRGTVNNEDTWTDDKDLVYWTEMKWYTWRYADKNRPIPKNIFKKC